MPAQRHTRSKPPSRCLQTICAPALQTFRLGTEAHFLFLMRVVVFRLLFKLSLRVWVVINIRLFNQQLAI